MSEVSRAVTQGSTPIVTRDEISSKYASLRNFRPYEDGQDHKVFTASCAAAIDRVWLQFLASEAHRQLSGACAGCFLRLAGVTAATSPSLGAGETYLSVAIGPALNGSV